MPKRKFSPEIAGFFTLVLVMSVLGYRWEKANFHWATIILAIFMYLVRGFSITVYYHRYATHKEFKMARSLRTVMAVCSPGAILLPVLKWWRRHEDHHQYTDDPVLDPNCAGQPRAAWWEGFKAFIDVHIGQVICSRYQDRPVEPGEKIDSIEIWQNKWYWPLALTMAFLLPTVIAWTWGDAVGGLLVAGFMPTGLQYNGAFLVNSGAHSSLFGRKSGHWSSATNLVIWGWQLPISVLFIILSLGEVLGHEVHHERPGKWDTGWKWVNPTSIFILGLKRLGLVWGLREF